MEMMRNPAAMQQAVRSQELAMSQLENLPGGFNALRRMYEDVQEPLMEAAASSGARGTGSTTAPSSTVPQPTAPTTSALPNPWGAPAPQTGNGMGGGAGGFPPMGGGTGGAPGANPFAAMMGGGGMGGGMGGMGGMGNGMGGMGGMDPAQMATMMQNPMVQQMMQQMLQDPNAIQQMSAMNPQLGAALQNPQVRQMMSNPNFLRQMTNPATMQVYFDVDR